MSNQKGQSTIEMALMALALVTLIVTLVAALYLMYSSYWAEHLLYESLICTQERGDARFCKHDTQEKIKTILFHEDFDLKLTQSPSQVRGQLLVRFHPLLLGSKTFVYVKSVGF